MTFTRQQQLRGRFLNVKAYLEELETAVLEEATEAELEAVLTRLAIVRMMVKKVAEQRKIHRGAMLRKGEKK